MSILYDKPFKNYNEQIGKLEKEYGLNLSISSYTSYWRSIECYYSIKSFSIYKKEDTLN